MSFDDYKLVIYRNQPDGWVAEIPAIAGCHALMPTAKEAVVELAKVFQLIEEEHRSSGKALPRDSTEIVQTWRPRYRASAHCSPALKQNGHRTVDLRTPPVRGKRGGCEDA